ncbi:MAG: S28 family serine protease [Salinivirgaceae bacterium]|jgi:hypothetical protein|nr:S28 family serine protease [Salinivirgaceae bacterium]
MKYKFIWAFSFLVLVFFSFSSQQLTLKEQLENLPHVVSVDSLFIDTFFTEQFDVYFEQVIDHNNPEEGTFLQRVIVSNSGFYKPVVVVIEGYNIWHGRALELTQLLKSNQVNIEHRFFKNSRPDSIPWDKLTIWQAASDQHKIIKSLKKIYKGNWLSTGFSKGGQATMYHRSFYPDDVKASVPYVAPLNLAREDERIYEFLKTVGSDSDRQKVYQFQCLCFDNIDELKELLKTKAKSKGWTYKMGIKNALVYTILEYSFAFWQYGGVAPENIPDNTATVRELFEHLDRISSFTFFEDKGIKTYQPFFWAALTEIGMYGYETKPFRKYLGDTVNYTFDFSAPEGTRPVYNSKAMLNVKTFLDNEAENMLFIVGGMDTWGATAYTPSGNNNLVTKKLTNGFHGTQIQDFSKSEREEMYSLIEEWMGVEIDDIFEE